MQKKYLILILTIAGIVFYLNSPDFSCDEKRVVLEGKLDIVHSKYPIEVIKTSGKTYWMYGAPKNFIENLNNTVRIEAIISPAYSQDIKCNICYRQCKNCQCPLDEELLYDVKILEVLDDAQ